MRLITSYVCNLFRAQWVILNIVKYLNCIISELAEMELEGLRSYVMNYNVFIVQMLSTCLYTSLFIQLIPPKCLHWKHFRNVF